MKKNIVIVLLVVAVLGLGGFVVYDKVLKKDEVKENNKNSNEIVEQKASKLDETKDYYYFKKTEAFGEILKAFTDKDVIDEFKNIKFLTVDGKIEFKYPVINIDSEDVKRLNKQIEDKIISLKTDYISREIINDNEEETCVLKWKLYDQSDSTSGSLEFYSYEIFESENYISIVEYTDVKVVCAGEGKYIVDVYNIDKNTGKLLTKEDIINENKLSDDFIEKIETQIYEDDDFNLEEYGEYYFKFKDEKLFVIVEEEYQAKQVHEFEFKNNKWVMIEEN